MHCRSIRFSMKFCLCTMTSYWLETTIYARASFDAAGLNIPSDQMGSCPIRKERGDITLALAARWLNIGARVHWLMLCTRLCRGGVWTKGKCWSISSGKFKLEKQKQEGRASSKFTCFSLDAREHLLAECLLHTNLFKSYRLFTVQSVARFNSLITSLKI